MKWTITIECGNPKCWEKFEAELDDEVLRQEEPMCPKCGSGTYSCVIYPTGCLNVLDENRKK